MAEEEYRERRRDEKDEKNEKDEKDRGEEVSIEEKWARDPLSAVIFGLCLIFAGAVLVAANFGLPLITWDNAWSIIFIGAGLFVLLEIALRYLFPEYRRPLRGRLLPSLTNRPSCRKRSSLP